MDEELSKIFNAVETDIIFMFDKWLNFKELFGVSKERIELLNSVSPEFFYLCQNVLWENLLLSVAKLIDSKQTGYGKNAKPNATLDTIISNIKDEKLKFEIQNTFQIIKEKGSFCTDWRNRYIAHTDYSLRLQNGNFKPLELSSRIKLQEVLTLINELMNTISKFYYNDMTIDYQEIIGQSGAEKLLNYLSKNESI